MGQPAILLMGPTGAGKTDAALELVGRLPLEIVSVDSAMAIAASTSARRSPMPRCARASPIT